MASSDQILDSPSSSKAKANSSTLDYYMYKASGEVVSSATMTCVQSVSQTTPSTTKEFVKSLQAWDKGSADQIGQTHLPLSFGLADAVQSVSGCNSSVDASNPTTNVVQTLERKAFPSSLTVVQATRTCLALRILSKRPNGEQGLQWRPLHLLMHTAWMAKSRPHFMIH